MKTRGIFRLPDSSDIEKFIREVAKSHKIVREPAQSTSRHYYDTFDWRLYRQKLTCYQQGLAFHISHVNERLNVTAQPWKQKRKPAFWWDFAEGAVRDILRDHLSVRALAPLFSLKAQNIDLRILNKDAKTVLRVRISVNQILSGGRDMMQVKVLQLTPVRGYSRSLQQFERFLADLGMKPADVTLFSIVAKAAGKKPVLDSNRPAVRLQAADTAAPSVKKILMELLQVIRLNESGIIQDIDTEFLHDFRVAVRRTRSALSQIKGIFARDEVLGFRTDFARLTKSTNALRDLDVYLLKKGQYKAMLPEHLQSGLQPLFKRLQRQRRTAHKNLITLLTAPEYHDLLQHWEQFLRDEASGKGRNADKAVSAVARKFIRGKYKQVRETGAAIGPDSPDAELHRLRIECKKLRYLMEFFQSLYPAKEIKQLIKQLKLLQDNLGDFNDFSGQREQLQSYLHAGVPAKDNAAAVTAAVGALIGSLYQKQQATRKLFSKTFKGFVAPENMQLFERTLHE